MVFTRKNNQVGPTTFDNSKRYMLWDSGCTNYIKPYFDLYTQYKPLDKGGGTEVNGVGGSSIPRGRHR